MAEANQLEQTAKNAPQITQQEKKEETKEKQPSALDEILRTARNATNIGVGAAVPFVFNIPGTPIYNPSMGINSAVTALPLSVGSGIEDKMKDPDKPINWKKARNESIVGTIITPPLAKAFDGIEVARQYVTNSAGAIPGGAAAVAALAGVQAVFVGAYMGINHVVQNLSFKGLYEKMKKDYWPAMKRTWLYVLPFSALNVLYIPTTALYKTFGVALQLAYGSLMTLLFRLVGPKAEGVRLGNLAKAMNPVPYISGGLTATAKLAKSVIYNPLKALYEIGSNFYKATPKPTPPVQETAGAKAGK